MDLKELKSKIPHGYCKIIAERAGVTQHSVSKFLTGKFKSQRIENAALEVIAEISKAKAKLLSEII